MVLRHKPDALARDLLPLLALRACEGWPSAAGYRLRKFARRNKWALAAVALLGVTLVVAVGAMAGSIG